METFWITSTKKYVVWTDCKMAKFYSMEKVTLAQVRMLLSTGHVSLSFKAMRVYRKMTN